MQTLPPSLPMSSTEVSTNHCLSPDISPVIVLGESGVGKTSFIRRFIDRLYCPDFPKTVSVDIASTKIESLDGRDIKCKDSPLDTLVTPPFLLFTQVKFGTQVVIIKTWNSWMFISGHLHIIVVVSHDLDRYPFGAVSGVLLLYDISNRESFEKICFWIELLRSLPIITPLLFHLVATKVYPTSHLWDIWSLLERSRRFLRKACNIRGRRLAGKEIFNFFFYRDLCSRWHRSCWGLATDPHRSTCCSSHILIASTSRFASFRWEYQKMDENQSTHLPSKNHHIDTR